MFQKLTHGLRVAHPVAFFVFLASLLAGGSPRTGPETEKRFPPLKMPPGFRATLFACDPFIEYPSVIAAGPRVGTLFVAIDYMTGLGIEIVRRDEIRLLEDTDKDGYADRSTVFAEGFNSIMGLAHAEGTVYVMHAPFLTALRDTDGDGKADERKDLLTGLGLTPEKNPVRLHCANGVVVGHDGWLYLALGDNGVAVPRPEGDRLILEGGGVLRCRPDGRDLHIFARGLRNIYDVALDADLNVFLRDNENDGGDYMNRLYHSFFGADHGYPYLYYERPEEALPPLGDLGLGSSAGGVCYLETAFPAEYRGDLFWCEWGRAVMRSRPVRQGSSFAPLKEEDFAAAAAEDPYGFKPTDLVVGLDGALFVSDWADGQRPKRGRGRIYRIVPEGKGSSPEKSKVNAKPGPTDWIHQLDAPNYSQRCAAQGQLQRLGLKALPIVQEALQQKRLGTLGKLHAIWILANLQGQGAVEDLFALVRNDPDSRVQAQAVRAIADLSDPVFTQHRLEATPGSSKLAAQLVELAKDKDPRVVREIIVSLGRLRWAEMPTWLQQNQALLSKDDPALKHACLQSLRASQNWTALLKLLDLGDAEPLRSLALRAMADQYQPEVVEGLITRLQTERNSSRRKTYGDWLTRVYQKPGPWIYWGYRPPPRPAPTVAWEKTEAITKALDRLLTDPDRTVRRDILVRMQREKIPTRLATLNAWLNKDHDAGRVKAILVALQEHPAAELRPLLGSLVRDTQHTDNNRMSALSLLAEKMDAANEPMLLTLAESLEEGPVLGAALTQLGRRPKLTSHPFLLNKTQAKEPLVRAAALDALADLQVIEAAPSAEKMLQDPAVLVQCAAARAIGKLQFQQAAPTLLRLARDGDPALRVACLESLRQLKDRRVVPLAAAVLDHPDTRAVALNCLEDLGGPEQAKVVADLALRQPGLEQLGQVIRMLSRWSRQEKASSELEQLLAQVQGTSGALVRWHVSGPLNDKDALSLREKYASKELFQRLEGTILLGSGPEYRVVVPANKLALPGPVWLAATGLIVNEAGTVQFLASSNGPMRLWLDGQLLLQREEVRNFQPDADRVEAKLAKGFHRVLVEVRPGKDAPTFHVRFRKKSSSAIQEEWTQLALSRPGSPDRGKKVFFNVARSQCLNCHRLGDQGQRIGPDLTGVGKRFARIFLIESIIDPNRSLSAGFQPLVVELKDGRTLTALRLAETPTTLTLADGQGKKLDIPVAMIESRQLSQRSIMPEGLDRQLTKDEFVDLIAFLVSQK